MESSNPSVGSKIIQKTDENLDTQKWIIKETDVNTYYIYSKCGNLCIDVPSGNTSSGNKLQLWGENGTNSQRFIFVKEK